MQMAVTVMSSDVQSIGTPSYRISITRPVKNESVGLWNISLMAAKIPGSIGFLSTFTDKSIPAITVSLKKKNIFGDNSF